ncbi:hypothetical protein K469DRAFT_732212 [Zopfia rhizophila CBS 207.26]|uniref:Microbial-type PARG catalytic domain-containing protein n=1 Tax=Zopfia rhizophila CBS 207.26 TaxID=1314779 RepID=A0A6A6DHK3_9PEZI|nr:hypothetical protein K469DRAFT_732212 [Zopfia rhizophila CBS 207.26]
MSAAALKRRNELRAVAAETKAILPQVLDQLKPLDTIASSSHHLRTLQPLRPENCPIIKLPATDPEAGRKRTRIRVYDQDTFDAALDLQPGTTITSLTTHPNPSLEPTSASEPPPNTEPNTSPSPASIAKPVAVLNLASERRPGGGWLNGALAQEEALCFRSSLSLTLHSHYYPIPVLGAIYSPTILLIRNSIVISIAAIRRPVVGRDGRYAKEGDRKLIKGNIRVVLRIAASHGHRKLVLGALGCGAFRNPPEEVASCFLEVFREEEFSGGWWEDVVFAVLDNAREDRGGKDGEGNFGVFYRALDGVVV